MTFVSLAKGKDRGLKLVDSWYFCGTTGKGNSITIWVKKTRLKKRVSTNCLMLKKKKTSLARISRVVRRHVLERYARKALDTYPMKNTREKHLVRKAPRHWNCFLWGLCHINIPLLRERCHVSISSSNKFLTRAMPHQYMTFLQAWFNVSTWLSSKNYAKSARHR